MKHLLRSALTLFVLLTLLTGVIYPLCITIFSQMLFPTAANGNIIFIGGKPIGSALIGQNFTEPKYFWGRPSATGNGAYNGSASAGSNLGPLNPKLVETVGLRIEALRNIDPNNHLPIPIDLVTASASGLDPHISPAAALYQAERIARLRHIKVHVVKQLIADCTQSPEFGLFGQARVNVLAINLALDDITLCSKL